MLFSGNTSTRSSREVKMVNVAQLVRATDCGSVGRGFETHLSPQRLSFRQPFLVLSHLKKNSIIFTPKHSKSSSTPLPI